MKINYPFKDEIVKEIDFVRKRMLNNREIEKKIFYYSGIYGIFRRILNLDYNPHLQFAEFMMNTTYQQLRQRYDIIKSGDTLIPLTTEIFDVIIANLEEIGHKIEQEEDIFEELQKIVNITYLTTGNGYYLRDKGII